MRWIPGDLKPHIRLHLSMFFHWGLSFQHMNFGGEEIPTIVDAHTSAVDNEHMVSAEVVVVTQGRKHLFFN